MKLLDCELAVMVFTVHLQLLKVAAIVNCPFRGQFNTYRTLRPVALQWIWLFQESPISFAFLARQSRLYP
jgi:hypothetical protein